MGDIPVSAAPGAIDENREQREAGQASRWSEAHWMMET